MGVLENGSVHYSVQVQAQHTKAFVQQKARSIAPELINAAQVKTIFDNNIYSLVKNYPILNDKDMVNQNTTSEKTTLDLDYSEFSKIFTTRVDVSPGGSDQIGVLNCDCKRGLLAQACEKVIRAKKEKLEHERFPWGVDKPINDRDLYEWVRDFPDNEEFKQLTTRVEGFSTGFGLINRNGDGVVPITSEQAKMNWIRQNVIVNAQRQGLNKLYIFTPEGVGATEVIEQGITIKFIPTVNIDNIQQRVTDNRGFFGQMNPRTGNGNDLTDGILRLENSADAETVTAEILDKIGLLMQPQSLDLLYKTLGGQDKVSYKFSNYKYIAN